MEEDSEELEGRDATEEPLIKKWSVLIVLIIYKGDCYV